ncbi:sortase A [Raineyella antarctica]|uniref:Sortase A n=1 Tax=Raineyella antarctica TaxID=1577474 RepID=A0A1G6GCS4_9ACTN|nr:class E sortase [Raineyella antarctica]SDB79788.1 sortase A [Raineyella antarctica]
MSSPTARPATSARRSPVGVVVGMALLVVGLAVLGWFGYQFIGTTIIARQEFTRTTSGLEDAWAKSPVPGSGSAAGSGAAAAGSGTTAAGSGKTASGEVAADGTITRTPGAAAAIMRVPAWGDGWVVPILDGTSEQVLAKGLGWYEGTAPPGQVGNFAVAGHVVTHGQPFRRLSSLPAGSTVLVETRDTIYTYAIDSSTVVKDSDTWVVQPVPGHPGEQPTDRLITLTTCADLFRSPDRYIAFGHLVNEQAK